MASPMLFGFKSPSPDAIPNNRTSVHSSADSGGIDNKLKPAISSERLAYLKKLVDDAIREHRVFTIRGGWQTLRRAFLKRNWIEKFDSSKPTKPVPVSNSSDDLTSNLPVRQQWESPSAHLAKCERTIMSRLLQLHDVDFYWNSRKDQHDGHWRMNCHKLINRFSRSLFTSKEGLCLLLQQMYWHNETGVACVNFPRCYVLGFPDHYNNFVEDFRLTACMALLKFVNCRFDAREETYSIEGTVPLSSLQFAMDRLNEYLAGKKHLDIDVEIPAVDDELWNNFLRDYQKVVHEAKVFFEPRDAAMPMMVTAGRGILKNLQPYWPQVDLDGMKNIWIMKPGNKCRGRGIQLIKEVKDVTKIMELKLKYVVQKYIEKPLIIYNTKFDIRQWFLITGTQPLQIWIYRDSYLRFSSQKFSLDNFHESLHLTNHAVQCKYKNNSDRNKALPTDNMWDCHTFKEYLKQIGHEHKWDLVIFPGMRECIIGTMLACQETMDRRPNTFELYGADFILAEDFKPWLLEINSSPDLSSSTSVTSRMCPQCLEDIVKVVIDRKHDPTCETGLFEMIYKQNLPRAPAYLGMSLSIRGRRIFKRPKTKKDKENEIKRSSSKGRLTVPDRIFKPDCPQIQSLTRKYSGPVIADLMAELQKKIVESDHEEGFEVASPVPRTIKKKTQKTDTRVAKVDSHRPITKTNKRNCSPNRKSNADASSRATRTAPQQPRKSSVICSSVGILNGWTIDKPDLSLNSSRARTDDVWNNDTASTSISKQSPVLTVERPKGNKLPVSTTNTMTNHPHKKHSNTKAPTSVIKMETERRPTISKIKVNTTKVMQKGEDKKKTKDLFNILSTLKKEYDMIDGSSSKTRKPLETIREGKRVDSIKLEEVLKSKPKLTKKTSNHLDDRNDALKKRLDQIIEKHTVTLHNLDGNNSKTIGNMAGSKHSTFIDSLYVQNVKQRHNELMRYITNSVNFPNSPSLKLPKKKSSNFMTSVPTIINQPKPFSSEYKKTPSLPITHTTYERGPLIKDEIKNMRDYVDQAIKGNRIFTICGHYYTIRNSLLARGWVEKLHTTYIPGNVDAGIVRKLQFLTIPELANGLKDRDLGKVYKQVIYSKMVGNSPVSLYWDLNRDTYRNNFDNLKNTVVNFISKNRFNYANKQGLCESAKQAYWFNNPGVSYLRTPRSYCLGNNGDTDEFCYDFKVTATMSFLKWIINTFDNKTSKLISNSGKVPITHFHFALQECAKFARRLKHEDIDKDIPNANEQEWQEFLDSFYTAVHVGSHFKHTSLETELSLVHKSKTMLKKLSELWPYVEMDGFMNIWLLKPSYGSRGIGIHFCRTLQYVLKVIRDHKNNSYVVQKYIERPMLIHNTKFDIRQWFLISSTLPLTIWIYKECYFRFSSQTYNLRKLHESIHLTNNSVQSKYNNGNRDPCLPFHNMWFLKDFKEHLNNLGYSKVYDEIIYPGMKECITAAILANQEQIYRTPKAFELHGADFMITEDFKPWLIEINSKPALSPSTPVTSKLCPMVLEDVIKVVVDNARDPTAMTGAFELLYKENTSVLPQRDFANLKIDGTPLVPTYFLTPEQSNLMEKAKTECCKSEDSINIVSTSDYIKYIGKEMKKTLQELLTMIDKERLRRQTLREANMCSKGEELFSFMYSEDMERLKTNMKEIEHIFKQDVLAKVNSKESMNEIKNAEVISTDCPADLSVNLTKADDSLLHSNSVKIRHAISTLEYEQKAHKRSSYCSIMNIIENIKFVNSKDKQKPATKPLKK